MEQHFVISEKLAKLRSLHIRTERDEMFAGSLNRLLRRAPNGGFLPVPITFGEGAETRGIMVIDGPGGGKTQTIARGLKSHPAFAHQPDDKLLYIAASVPSPATMKSMSQNLLELTGYAQVSTRREVWSMWDVLRGRFEMLGTAVLWIDEAHDLFCNDLNLILRALKSLMQGPHPVIVIVSGTEKLASVISSDEQVHRRMTTLRLPAVNAIAHADDLKGIIQGYCERAELLPPDEGDLVHRLVVAASSRFGRCIELILGAVETALYAGEKQLRMRHFGDFHGIDRGFDSPAGNAFLVEDLSLLRVLNQDPMPQVARRKHRA